MCRAFRERYISAVHTVLNPLSVGIQLRQPSACVSVLRSVIPSRLPPSLSRLPPSLYCLPPQTLTDQPLAGFGGCQENSEFLLCQVRRCRWQREESSIRQGPQPLKVCVCTLLRVCERHRGKARLSGAGRRRLRGKGAGCLQNQVPLNHTL